MNFWLERSKKERGTVYVAAEHGGTEFFGTLHVGKRELLHAASLLGAAASCLGAAKMLRGTAKQQKRVAQAQKTALRRMRGVGKHK